MTTSYDHGFHGNLYHNLLIAYIYISGCGEGCISCENDIVCDVCSPGTTWDYTDEMCVGKLIRISLNCPFYKKQNICTSSPIRLINYFTNDISVFLDCIYETELECKGCGEASRGKFLDSDGLCRGELA